MPNNLTVQIKSEGDSALVSLVGEITEDSDFRPVLATPAKKLMLNLEGVQRINSTGVREWINFIVALGKENRDVTFERCSVAIVQQLNMIANFRGQAHITSIFAPYFCTTCDKDHTRLLDLREPLPNLDEPWPCPVCKEPMEFDDLPDAYLSFHAA